jgi:hypothetical protein
MHSDEFETLTLAKIAAMTPPVDCGVIPRTTPVVSFGDFTTAKIATLGINPSSAEFMSGGKLLVGENKRLSDEEFSPFNPTDIWFKCKYYFLGNPYWSWFSHLEELLLQVGASYKTNACHLDLSPWATDPIFGNLNPKRQIKAQRVIIEEIIQKFKSYNLEVACIKHDEIIYVVDDDITLKNILSEIDYNIFKTKIYKVERVEDFRINSYYDQSENFLHKELVGCNAHLYYLNLKRFIFREKIDIRDLYFRLDSKLAIWNYDGLKLELI